MPCLHVHITPLILGSLLALYWASVSCTDGRNIRSASFPDAELTSTQAICSDGYCDEINYEEYEKILTMYKGLFHTEKDIEIVKDKALNARKTQLQEQFAQERLDIASVDEVFALPGDGDVCCATEIVFHTNSTLMNLDDISRNIIHLTDAQGQPVYQFIPHGRCVNYGQCGTCVQESTIMSLLVYDPSNSVWPYLTFDLFSIPGYCSCKNPAA